MQTNIPNPKKLKILLKHIALLEAIFSPEWEYRYFSYDSKWDKNEEMANMRTGEGDEYFILFKNESVVGKYYTLNLNNKIIKDDFSKEVNIFLNEVAFNTSNISNLFFYSKNKRWEIHPNEKGMKYFFTTIEDYVKWARGYYEIEIDINIIYQIINGNLNDDTVKQLNNDVSIKDIYEDIDEIGMN